MYNSTIAFSPTGNGNGYIGNVPVPAIPVGDGFFPVNISTGMNFVLSLSPNESNFHRVLGPVDILSCERCWGRSVAATTALLAFTFGCWNFDFGRMFCWLIASGKFKKKKKGLPVVE